MASRNPAACVPHAGPASAINPIGSAAPAINPLLLASACSGYCMGLNILLNGQNVAGEIALPFDLRAAYASGSGTAPTPELLLEGVTVEGDTALHAVAINGDSENFLSSAITIYGKTEHLLFVQNNRGDTPLHLAARAGKYQMVSCLVDLASEIIVGVSRPTTIAAARVRRLLETGNSLNETALHEAIRIGRNDIVKLLMEEYPELARFPQDGTSPLYLAILLGNRTIAEILYGKSGGILSYSGPNGQNVLHAAALRGSDLTEMVLGWNKELTAQEDKNGSTPLHFAAGLLRPGIVCRQLLEANTAALYQSDNDGLFPIHVAASVGADRTVAMFLNKCLGSAGLRDAKGRTFLHVAVEEKMVSIVKFACGDKPLSWILNMRDKDGNTTLHLAVQAGSIQMVCAHLMNLQVELNVANDKGQTPRDISRYITPPGLFFNQNSEAYISYALSMVGARSGASREDHFKQKHKDAQQLKWGDESKELERIEDATRSMSIGSVLIATVTFGATFALPGGYIADDHENGGTPTRAGTGRYAFDAFIMANTLSFICSALATVGFMYSGTSAVTMVSRTYYLTTSAYLMSTSISSLTTAFALGVYVVLAPVAKVTAIAICVLSSVVVVSPQIEGFPKRALLARPLFRRNGLIWTLQTYARAIVTHILYRYWPIIFSFGWASRHMIRLVLRAGI